MKSGYAMILFAAKAAEEHFKDHWLKHWARAHSDRLARCKTDWGRRWVVSGLFGDIEKIVEELPQYERK